NAQESISQYYLSACAKPICPRPHAPLSLGSETVNPQDTPAEPTPDLQLEIAHLLLIDVVGYSKLLVNEQIELLQELKQIVRSTESFRKAEARGELIRVPTGDGMALVFFHSPEEPARCALEISRALQNHPSIQLRMGIHSGPVSRVTDVNEKTNIAGSESMLRSESWIAAMPSIFYCLGTWRRTYANTGIGNRACMILVNARSSTGCGCTCLTCTRMALAIRRFPRSSDEEEGDLPPPLASVQLLLHVGPRLRLQSLFLSP